MNQNRLEEAKLMLKQIHDLVTPGEFCQLVKEVAPEYNLFNTTDINTAIATSTQVPAIMIEQQSQEPAPETEQKMEIENRNRLRWSSPASMAIVAPSSPTAEVKLRGSESAKAIRRCVRSISYPITNCDTRLVRNSSEFRELVTAMSLKQLNKCNGKNKTPLRPPGTGPGSADLHSYYRSRLNSFSDSSVERELIPAA